MELGKIGKFFSFKPQNVVKGEPVKEQIVMPQISEETVKVASDAATAQAQAMINIDNSAEAKRNAKETANIGKLDLLRIDLLHAAEPKNPEDDAYMSAPNIQVHKEQGMEGYVREFAKNLINYYDAQGLDVAKSLIKNSKIDKEYADILTEEINAQLETLHLTPAPMPFTAEQSKANILELSPVDIEARKEELRVKFAEKLAQRHPARESAKVILEQSPIDLGQRKIDLQERYADKIKEKREKESAEQLQQEERLVAEKIEQERDARIHKITDFISFLPYPAFINVPTEVCIEQGMEEFVQAHVNNMSQKYQPAWIADVLELIDKEDEVRNQLDEDQKDMFREAIKSELEFLHYKKQFETDFPKKSAKTSAEIILEKNPVDLGKNKIDLESRYGEKHKEVKTIMQKYGLNLGQASKFLRLQKVCPDATPEVLIGMLPHEKIYLNGQEIKY